MNGDTKLNDFLESVQNNFNNLSDDDRDVLRQLKGTQQGKVLAKVLGPAFQAVKFAQPKNIKSKKRGLATR